MTFHDAPPSASGVAQGVLQVPGLQHDAQHEELQGLRQASLLRGVSTGEKQIHELSLTGILPFDRHVPKAKATIVADTPEMKRLAENSKLQSNVKYHAEFEATKGKFTQIADDPEIQRIKANSQTISNVSYHGVAEQKAEQEKKRSLVEGQPGAPPNAPLGMYLTDVT